MQLSLSEGAKAFLVDSEGWPEEARIAMAEAMYRVSIRRGLAKKEQQAYYREGQRLQRYRRRMRMKRDELAAALDVSPDEELMLECGLFPPNWHSSDLKHRVDSLTHRRRASSWRGHHGR
jgi:hypothetical protein